ncbi:MAG TPA: DoxX family protein [Burkholderiaceae bacterium]|nr:DoxX family protein [Burkholderiaceae bacterium]HQR76453.1 DoxX family protein [Burkholderiaceae bacterium]
MALLGRILLALVFLLSGIGKLRGFDGTMAYISSAGLPLPGVLAALALALEIVAGVALILGYRTRWAALALAAFTLVAAFLFHNFWSMPEQAQVMQQIMFLKNLAIAGGLLMVAAYGPGAWSVDRR